MSNSGRSSKKRSGGKRNVGKKILYIFTSLLGVVVILMSVAYGAFYHYYSKMNITSDKDFEYVSKLDITEGEDIDYSKMTDEEREALNYDSDTSSDQELVYNFTDDVENILLVGTDSRHKGLYRTRTDAMVLVSINKTTHKIFLTSFMRDLCVDIKAGGNHKEAGKDKLNAAFAYGGSSMMFDTFKENFGIPIDKYVHMDFFCFVSMVNYIGGIDLYVKADERKVMNEVYIFEMNKLYNQPLDKDKLPLKTGMVHLNGKQALAYTRVRYVGGGDFGRTERQRKVLEEIMKKVKTMSASKLSKFAETCLRLVTTNLSQTDVMSLLVGAPDYMTYESCSARIPIDGTYKSGKVQGTYLITADLKKNADYWYSLVYLDKDISAEILQKIKDEKAKAEEEAESNPEEDNGT